MGSFKKNIERGARLRKLRFDKKLTQTELAKEVGLSSQQISHIESGRSFGINTATKLADFYGVDVNWLTEETFDLDKYKNYISGKNIASGLPTVDIEERFDQFRVRSEKYLMDHEEKIKELYAIAEQQDALIKRLIKLNNLTEKQI